MFGLSDKATLKLSPYVGWIWSGPETSGQPVLSDPPSLTPHISHYVPTPDRTLAHSPLIPFHSTLLPVLSTPLGSTMASSGSRSGMSGDEIYWDALVVEEEVSSRAADNEELARRLSLEEEIAALLAIKGQCSGVLGNSDGRDDQMFAPPKLCPSASTLPL